MRIISKGFTGRVVFGAMLGVALVAAGCSKQGPVERVGEEVDEAGRALKNGGEQTTADKIDDKFDKARENINDTADELKKDAK
jgi:hypothetical protein